MTRGARASGPDTPLANRGSSCPRQSHRANHAKNAWGVRGECPGAFPKQSEGNHSSKNRRLSTGPVGNLSTGPCARPPASAEAGAGGQVIHALGPVRNRTEYDNKRSTKIKTTSSSPPGHEQNNAGTTGRGEAQSAGGKLMHNTEHGPFYIYVYRDKNNVPRYVGKGVRNRDTRHLQEARRALRNNTRPEFPWGRYLKAALRRAEKITIERVAEHLTFKQADALERQLIARYGRRLEGTPKTRTRNRNGTLMNASAGGDGYHGHDEQRATLVNRLRARLGRPPTKRPDTPQLPLWDQP